jgi:hypothetical protein
MATTRDAAMAIPAYRKSRIVDFKRFDGTIKSAIEICEWLGDGFEISSCFGGSSFTLKIHTRDYLKSPMLVSPGDWIELQASGVRWISDHASHERRFGLKPSKTK